MHRNRRCGPRVGAAVAGALTVALAGPAVAGPGDGAWSERRSYEQQAFEEQAWQEEQARQEQQRARHARRQRAQAGAPMFEVRRGPLMQMLSEWPQKSQEVARTFIQKYGLPDEATPSLLIWHDNGPWKRTVVHREPIDHNFPVPHQDVVEQVVNYELPSPQAAGDITAFDGSVYVDRTRGELSAKCDKEAANILALNLADDVARGEKTVAEARRAYAQAIRQSMRGQTPEIMRSLQFETPPARVAGDPDEALLRRPARAERQQRTIELRP